jgi:hypothetical protein
MFASFGGERASMTCRRLPEPDPSAVPILRVADDPPGGDGKRYGVTEDLFPRLPDIGTGRQSGPPSESPSGAWFGPSRYRKKIGNRRFLLQKYLRSHEQKMPLAFRAGKRMNSTVFESES